MGSKNLLQTDFLAGEISPRMEMQDNLEGRKHGVELMENFFTHLQGTAETSYGTEWVADTAGTSGRIFGFPVSFSERFMVVIVENLISLINDDGTVLISWAAPWTSEEEMASIQAVMTPAGNEMIIVSEDYPPYLLGYVVSPPYASFAPLSLTSAPWSSAPYPATIGFFGSRMWVGRGSGFWGSQISTPPDYGDFTLGVLATDAIAASLDRQGDIRWISGGAGLLIGTSNAEHIIYAEGGVIVPGDIQSKVQSTNGSYPTMPLEVGNEIMYASPDGRKIRSSEYEFAKDAWRSRDVTYASEHITKDNEIINLAYSANPYSRILGTTSIGEIVSGTYDPYSKNAGFSRRSTQGDILSVAVVPYGGVDEVWMLVDRGNGVLHIEKEGNPENTKLDSFTTFSSVVPISGGTVAHLASKTCQVTIDGAIHPDIVPDVSGVFTTEYSGYEIKIGLQISSIIVTLPVADVKANVGTTRTMMKRWTSIWVRILDSWKPKINGRRPPARLVATPMGNIEPARTESVEVASTGTDMEGKITIEQDLPLRTEIAGVFGSIIQEET